MSRNFKLQYYVPKTHLEITKAALFSIGAGAIGEYDSCAWQTKGQGQFRPLSGSRPAIGKHHELTYVDEYKVEIIIPEHLLVSAKQALLNAHPYEVPAYEFFLIHEVE